MEQLIEQLKAQIIEALNFEDMTPADIETDAPLFGEGLGLDSIDALELIMLRSNSLCSWIANMELNSLTLKQGKLSSNRYVPWLNISRNTAPNNENCHHRNRTCQCRRNELFRDARGVTV